MNAAAPLSATGWIADNWPAFADEACPPIIVNPDAPVGAVLAWCYGELVSMSSAATALCCVSDGLSVDEISCIFRHRLEPIVRVMSATLDRLAVSARAEKTAMMSAKEGGAA